MRIPIALALTALLLAGFAPVAEAHGAPAARSFETRVMHDHNDDSLFMAAQGKHGFDAIALDVREGFDLGTGPVMIFRLLLNGGCNANALSECPELRHVIKFKADGADQSIAFITDDEGETWTGDAVRFEGPFDLNDGTRFAIEGWVPMSSIGVGIGSELTEWFVEGYAGDETADNMPEGAIAGYEDPLDTAFVVDKYTVKSYDFYLSADAGPDTVEVQAGEEIVWAFNVTNSLADTQTIRFQTIGLDAEIVRDEVIESDDMAPNVTRSYEVRLAPEQSGTVTIVITSDLGGATAMAFAVKVPAKNTGLTVTSPDIIAGGNFSHTFGVMGTFEYHDHHNAAVGGKITIDHASDNVTAHTIRYDGSAFTPAELTIGKGDTVTWINDSDGTMMIMGSGEAGHDHGDHDHGEADDKESPGAPLVLLALGLLAAVLVARRR